MSSDWIEFWDKQTLFPDVFLKRGTELFFQGTQELLGYNDGDDILDIGCGPGHLAAQVADRVNSYCGLDCSDAYLKTCREVLGGKSNCSFHELPADYTDFSVLTGRTFSKIICLSVIQYYDDKQRVEKLIESVRALARPGSLFIIADICVDTGLFSDLKALVRTALKERLISETLRFVFRARFGRYGKLAKSQGILRFTRQELEGMIRRLELDADILDSRLTLNTNRSHMLIRL